MDDDYDLEPINKVPYEPEDTIEDKFIKFHQANPHVYHLLVSRSLALFERGFKHFGIAAIFESLRYDAALKTGGDKYKLSNDYRAFYARIIMANVAALDGFFTIKEQTFKGKRDEL